MRTVAAVIALAIVLSAASDAQAGERRRIFQGRAAHSRYDRHHRPPSDARELYPKYIGGFHARALQNIGVPSGDIGIRGNGIYMNPW
jgi:hypothetical protein